MSSATRQTIFLWLILSAFAVGHGERASIDILPLAKARGIESDSTNHQEVLPIIQAQAAQGSVEGLFILGLLHLYGEENEEAAMISFKRAAEEGHNDAQCAVGLLLHHGQGRIKSDRTIAKAYFRRASEDGYPYGRWLLGRSLFNEASSSMASDKIILNEAVLLLSSVADLIPEAAHLLAIMHEYGMVGEEGAGEGSRAAAALYEKAARQGLVESMYHLALMHVYGRGVAKDYTVAADLFRTAATNRQRSHTPSMRYLAVIYANGYSHPAGIPDYDAALRWYEACAAAHDFPDLQRTCRVERKSLSDAIEAAKASMDADI